MNRIIFLLCIGLVTGFPTCVGAAAPVRILFLTGETDLPYHEWRVTTPFLKQVLENTGRFEVKVAEEVRGLTARTLAGFDGLVLNYNGPRWGEETERAIEDFIRSGKGMVAVHGVSYGPFFGSVQKNGRWGPSPTGDTGWKAYREMIGSDWRAEDIGHAVRHVFPVKWTDREHPISRGLDESFLANDELYHKMDLKPNVRVLARAYSEPKLGGTGKEEPLIWTVPFGAGRVVHITLGHDTSAMYQPGFLAAFARSTEWSSTGGVTLPPVIPATAAPKKDAVRVLVVTGGHSYPTSFYTLFEGYPDISWQHATSPAEAFRRGMKDRYDCVVLHDMREDLGEAERVSLRDYVEAGKGIVSIHHAIVNYTAWPWWHEEVIGGKFFAQPSGSHAKSAYKEDVDMLVRAVKGMSGHPVLRGVSALPVQDETYSGMWHSPKITVLMETDSALNDRPVVYIGPHPKARAIYIQLGHGDSTIRHPAFRTLVRNAILWSGRKVN